MALEILMVIHTKDLVVEWKEVREKATTCRNERCGEAGSSSGESSCAGGCSVDVLPTRRKERNA